MDFSLLVTIGLILVVFTLLLSIFQLRKKTTALEIDLAYLRKAKAFDETEIKRLQEENAKLLQQLGQSRIRSSHFGKGDE